MNYYIMKIIRFILVVICLVIVGIINGLFVKKKSKNINRINWLIVLIIYIGIFAFPFESFIKHRTIEDSFHYTYPTYKIREEYVYEDCAYILYSHNGENGFAYFVKENNYWNMIKNQNIQTKTYNSFTIVTYKNESYNNSCRNKAGISVISTPSVSGNINVTDSQSSNFITIVMEDKLVSSNTFVSNLAIIDDVNEDYTVFLDNNEFKPFQ